MTSQHRTHQLRVDAPTLEPDVVFLGMLADLSASSRAAGPRTARSAGLRMIVATASVAVVAAATWAGGNGMETPLSPADAPSQQEPSGPPSHGDVATPQRDVSISPGSPVSPGLPGTPSSGASQAHDDDPTPNIARRNASNGKAIGKADAKAGKAGKAGKDRAKHKSSRTERPASTRSSRK